jgi:hypothetical protein
MLYLPMKTKANSFRAVARLLTPQTALVQQVPLVLRLRGNVLFGDRLMVGRQFLNLAIKVRTLVPEPGKKN